MSLFDQLNNSLDSFDYLGGKTQMSSGVGGGLSPQKGNPNFKTQIDIDVKLVYSKTTIRTNPSSFAMGESVVATPLSIKELGKGLDVPLPVYLFGNSDSKAGFKRSKQITPIFGGWSLQSGKILTDAAQSSSIDMLKAQFLNGTPDFASLDVQSYAQKIGKAVIGDMVLTYIYMNNNNTNTSELFMAEVVISCPQVAYGTLLDSVSSDSFKIDGVRYSVSDVTKLSQFNNTMDLARQSLFGKLSTDSINPFSQKLPTNQQDNIIDIGLVLGVDKNQMLNTYINYDCSDFKLSLFIPAVQKLKA